MNAQDLLTDLSRRGIRLSTEHGYLCIDAPRGAIDDDLKRRLAAHKAAILAALSKPQIEDAITQQHWSTVPVDALGYPFRPCTCGCRHFWSADGRTWYCSDCCPDHHPLVDTLTL